MSTALRQNLSYHWFQTQQVLFPYLTEVVGPLTKHHEQLISVLEFVRIEEIIRTNYGLVGRPEEDRRAIFRAFIAKAVFNLPTNVLLREYLLNDPTSRRICGFHSRRDIPSESTFSRAFSSFCETGLPGHVHEALILMYQSDRLVGHISRDSTAIEARESINPVRKTHMIQKAKDSVEGSCKKTKRGRPKAGEIRPLIPLTRLERQVNMSLEANASGSAKRM